MATILIVDDDFALRHWLAAVLRADGHQVISVESGEALFGALTDTSPDLILLDVLLPDMDGMEVVRRLRQMPQTVSVPVILVTVLNPARYQQLGMDLGADEYLAKPLNSAKVQAAVKRQLAQGRRIAGDQIA